MYGLAATLLLVILLQPPPTDAQSALHPVAPLPSPPGHNGIGNGPGGIGGPGKGGPKNADYVPGIVLVKPKPGVNLNGLHKALGASVLKQFPAIGNLQVVKVPPSTNSNALIVRYLESGLVQYAEHDSYVHMLAVASPPNDPLFTNQWALHNTGQLGGTPGTDIDALDAWNIQHDATNIVVAVVDTGVRYTHEDLAANMWVNPADGSHGTNVVFGTADPSDDFGHGSHVAGIIGAVGNNGVGVAGVAWHVQIMACKFIDTNGNGAVDGAISCLDYARSHGANIINASWGLTNLDVQSLHDAIASLRDAGILFVAACGNSSADNEVNPIYPASFSDLDNIISVAATDNRDRLADFSNWGQTNVDLAAPGASIFSCWDSHDHSYMILDGTSMSCAFVSGAAALLEASNTNANYRQIKQQLDATVDPLPSLQGKCISGGRLDLFKALSTSIPPSFTANFEASPTNGPAPLAVQFTDASTGNPVSWNWNFGDGGTSTDPNPVHTFNTAGSFTVTLMTTGSSGQTSSASQTITTTAPAEPVLNIFAAQADAYAGGTFPGTVRFVRTGDPSLTYQVNWAFSGTASNGVDFEYLPTSSPFPADCSEADLTITPINHGQTNDTTVTVTLESGSDYQVGVSNIATIIIHGLPNAGFAASPSSGQAPLAVQFNDQTTGPVETWNWDFGDGATSTDECPAHTYASAGTYHATLTITGDCEQTNSVTHDIVVTDAPSPVYASFTANPYNGQAPLTVQFNDQSSGPVNSWSWNFGDGATSTNQCPAHTYASAGSYSPTLTVTGSSGQTSSANQSITATNAPAPSGAALAANPASGQ